MKSFEDQIFRNIDKKNQNPILDKEKVSLLCQKISKKIERERSNPENFYDVFTKEEIEKELSIVESLEKKWSQDKDPESIHAKNLANIAEFVIHSAIGNWTDAKINSIISSKPDDYLRKIDLVLEMENEPNNNEFLPVGIDVVITGKGGSAGLDEKLSFLKNEILVGRECLVKYVESESFKGSITAPRAVIALSSEHLNDYIKILESGKMENLENHQTKYTILYQLQQQYYRLFKISQQLGHDKLALDYARVSNSAFNVFEDIYSEIQKDVRLRSQVESDPGIRSIDNFLDNFEKEVSL